MDRRILALRQGQLGKMPHAQPEPPRLETAQQVHWSRLKIATNVVGVICSSKPRQPLVVLSQRKQRRCVLMGRSGYQQRLAWDLVQLRAWTGPMEKMSHRGEGPIRHHTAERASSGCRTTADETLMSHRSGPGLQPTHSLLSYEPTWNTMLLGCLSD